MAKKMARWIPTGHFGNKSIPNLHTSHMNDRLRSQLMREGANTLENCFSTARTQRLESRFASRQAIQPECIINWHTSPVKNLGRQWDLNNNCGVDHGLSYLESGMSPFDGSHRELSKDDTFRLRKKSVVARKYNSSRKAHRPETCQRQIPEFVPVRTQKL
jgi:hypothetical protein